MKANTLQLLFAFAYPATPGRGATPNAERTGHADAVLVRVRRAFGAEPYAVSLAARTDAGVAAKQNWLSCRLRVAPLREGALCQALAQVVHKSGSAAAETRAEAYREADDLLDVVEVYEGYALTQRTMARADAGRKTYRYVLDGEPSVPAWRALRTFVGGINEATFFAHFCHRTAARASKAQKARAKVEAAIEPLTLPTGAPGLALTVCSQAFLRHQVRHLAGAIVQLMDRPDRAAHLVSALKRSVDKASVCAGAAPSTGEAYVSPAPACAAAPASALTLMSVAPAARWQGQAVLAKVGDEKHSNLG